MTTPGHGARDNGLRCAGYTPIRDLDPRVADAVLAELRDVGIAAYVTPVTGTTGGYMETRLPDRPIDRLWVDSANLDRARALVDDRTPQSPESAAKDIDFDQAWDELVTSLRGTDTTSVPVWPEQPAVASDDESRVLVDADREEHFVPPAPPPLPKLRTATIGAVVAIVVGLFILGTGFDGGQFTWLGALGIIGGVASLIYHMKQGPPTDSGWDDGAVV
jgi:hypothetical protein